MSLFRKEHNLLSLSLKNDWKEIKNVCLYVCLWLFEQLELGEYKFRFILFLSLKEEIMLLFHSSQE